MMANSIQASGIEHCTQTMESRYDLSMTEQRDSQNGSVSGAHETSAENSAQTRDPQGQAPDRPERRGPPPNPLYHPLFLPVLLIAFSLWFGYDGFLTSDPDMLKHQTFNRIMFGIMLPICLWMVPRGIKEFREEQAQAANKHSGSNPS
jgi:hypothetical protein